MSRARSFAAVLDDTFDAGARQHLEYVGRGYLRCFTIHHRHVASAGFTYEGKRITRGQAERLFNKYQAELTVGGAK
ncbi:MAG: hypothetical protein DI547_17370 [Sphingobium sp.]|nr:MAG: hypothetical protein DI547_17370 [Sphingobium sp.]